MAMLALVEPPELLVKTVLGLHGDGNDVRVLTLSTSFQDQIGATTMMVVPGRLDEEPSGVNVTGFGDRASSFAISGRAFGRYQAEVGHE